MSLNYLENGTDRPDQFPGMKRLRRCAVICVALFLGIVAWIAVLLSGRSEEELRFSRQLGSGRMVVRVEKPIPPLRSFEYGDAHLSARVLRHENGREERMAVPTFGVLTVVPVPGSEQEVWYVNLDPRDKSWDLEIAESRPVFLRAGSRRIYAGTKTRIWRSHRRERH